MIKSIRKYLTKAVFVLLLSPAIAKSQSASHSAKNWKKGTFTYYVKNTNERFVTKRDNDFQIEKSNKTGDSILLKINWLNDYNYTLKYVSGSGKAAASLSKSIKKHTLIYQVTIVTNDFYVYKSYFDKISKHSIQTDTIWLKEKTFLAKNDVSKQNEAYALASK